METQLELWTNLTALDRGDPQAFVERASMLEADGWDGATMPDSHAINPEVYVTLGACAQATSKLKLGPGVGNPATRHPAVIAATMVTLNKLFDGRIVAGMGRGDASLAYVGGSPVSLKAFESALEMMKAYMRGEAVSLEVAASALARNSKEGFGDFAIEHAPEGSKLKWVTPEHKRPPLEVFATGPKVIAIGARQADYLTFALGADVERLRWAVGVAREEMERIGRDPAELKFGAHIPVFPHSDVGTSRALGEGYIAAQARFGVMNKKPVGPMSEKQQSSVERLAKAYDMQNHGMTGSSQAKTLDDEFVDNFGIVGRPENGVERLKEIMSLGISRLQLVTSQSSTPEGAESYRMTTSEILPALRAAQS